MKHRGVKNRRREAFQRNEKIVQLDLNEDNVRILSYFSRGDDDLRRPNPIEENDG